MRSMTAGSVRYYAAALSAGHVVIDDTETRLPLRHGHHRYTIQANDGSCRTLSVPLEGTTNAMPVALRDVVISNHGRWRAEHWGALYSAYGRSPFFDYIAPELHRLLVEGKQHYLLELNNDLQQLVCEFVDLPVRWTMRSLFDSEGEPVADLRRCTAGKHGDTLPVHDVAYHQVWQERAGGFTAGLSILDLVFNTGREAIITLSDMTQDINTTNNNS